MSILRIDNLTVGYDRPVLEGVSLTAEPGQMLAIVGPNASGKSTLLAAMLGLLKPTVGAIYWHDRPLADWHQRELAKRVALLPQRPTAAAGHRVSDVLLSGRSPHWNLIGSEEAGAASIVESVAERLALTDLLGRRLTTLSGGQRQRVFIGRSLVQIAGAASPVLILDEPDASLDIAQSARLMRLLKTLTDTTVILVTHHLDHAAQAEQIALIDHGRVRCGSTEDLIQSAPLSAAFDTPLVVHRNRDGVTVTAMSVKDA